MQITLNDDEVREALREALEQKIVSFAGGINIDQCYFTVTAGGKEVDDLEEVEFTVNL